MFYCPFVTYKDSQSHVLLSTAPLGIFCSCLLPCFCVDPNDNLGEQTSRTATSLVLAIRSYLIHVWSFRVPRNMFDEKRYLTSVTYLSCLGATLVIIFIPMPGVLKFIIILCLTLAQFCASTWYSLSYIPYGRRAALRIIKKVLGIEDTTNYAGIQVG